MAVFVKNRLFAFLYPKKYKNSAHFLFGVWGLTRPQCGYFYRHASRCLAKVESQYWRYIYPIYVRKVPKPALRELYFQNPWNEKRNDEEVSP